MNKFKLPDKPARNVDTWVAGQDVPAPPAPQATIRQADGKLARLTIDLPTELHARFKSTCALKGTRMIDVVRGCIEEWTQKNG